MSSLVRRVPVIRHPDVRRTIMLPVEMPGQGKRFTCVHMKMRPGATVRPHRHRVTAVMLVTAGSVAVISDDPAINGKVLTRGMQVTFEKNRLHAYQVGKEGCEAISQSTGHGIVARNPRNWDWRRSRRSRTAA